MNLLPVVIFITTVVLVFGGSHGDETRTSSDIAEDAGLDTAGLLTKYGYPNEVHTVVTEDGFILTVHRIPHLQGQDPQQSRPVVFLMHGLLSSSADWVNMGPGNGLGYLLADEGYDVWMGNARGNTYSRKHVYLNPDTDVKFWRFSWNEIGYYDLPAMIDYVLAKTGVPQLHYVGHSQGTTTFFVMCSRKEEYNDKFKSMNALAPMANMTESQSPLFNLLASITNTSELLSPLIGENEFLPSTELMSIAEDLLCKDNAAFQPVCSNILFLLCGFNPDVLNTTMLPIMLAHTPAGASSRLIMHYGQEHQSARFCDYDHGYVFNLLEYGSAIPPEYLPQNITAPVALHYATGDWMADPLDVLRLYEELGNPDGIYLIDHPTFNHLDFLWAIDVKSLVYDNVIRLMKARD